MNEDLKSDSKRLLLVMLVFVLVIIFAAGIYYFISKPTAGGKVNFQLKTTSLEEKIATLETQIADLKGKPAAEGPDSSLVNRVDALSQRVDALEKKANSATESKEKPASPKSSQKRYHTVRKGESLSSISKQYGISTEELRKLNGLSRNQPVQTGQKLLISAGQ